jgi:hypothetical protein
VRAGVLAGVPAAGELAGELVVAGGGSCRESGRESGMGMLL